MCLWLVCVLVYEELQAALESVAHGLELPLAVALVESAELDGCLDREVFVEVIFGYLLVCQGIVDADI